MASYRNRQINPDFDTQDYQIAADEASPPPPPVMPSDTPSEPPTGLGTPGNGIPRAAPQPPPALPATGNGDFGGEASTGVSPTIPNVDMSPMAQFRRLKPPEPPKGSVLKTIGAALLANRFGDEISNRLMHPTYAMQRDKYNQQVSDLENAAKMDISQRGLEANEELKKANALKARGAAYDLITKQEDRQTAMEDKKSTADAAMREKQYNDAIKIGGMGGKQQASDAPIPNGYFSVPHPTDPKSVYLIPSTKTHFVANNNFVDMADTVGIGGIDQGDLISQDTFKTVAELAGKKTIQDAKPDKSDPAAKENPNQWTADSLNPDPAVSSPAKKKLELWKNTQKTPAINISTLPNDAATDQAAARYLHTGTLPPLGMGAAAAAARSKILNRAAEMDPTSDIASNMATYGADRVSLSSLQRTSDAVNAFEGLATKNLDRFVGVAKRTIDSGQPWANTVFRGGARMIGDPNAADFEAARITAFTEVAKVLNNPSSSAILSDSARKEANEVLNGNYTVQQLISVADLLKREMADRKIENQRAIDEINQRIGGKKKPSEVQSPSPAGQKIITVNGQKYSKTIRLSNGKYQGMNVATGNWDDLPDPKAKK